MTRPVTTFDLPPFSILPDTEWRKYGNVDNLLQIGDGLTLDGHEYVVVPTALFTLMRDVLKIERFREVSLFLRMHDDNKYVIFGLTDGIVEFDLWSYTATSLPSFLLQHFQLEDA